MSSNGAITARRFRAQPILLILTAELEAIRSGTYDVLVSNSEGEEVSEAVQLTVTEPNTVYHINSRHG